ncbi:acyltransferase family protein [Desertivirga arenae]|uniref:acyltransferase family protein n=1 Tax=Desertivirga arenae TaxID=2810309 RepID=UPI001A96F7A9|nr:acyltransferase [Pedobacter sp. SYSU D00823]
MDKIEGNVELVFSKQHFGILDGLRGLAAVAVVIFHFMEIAVPDYNDSFIAHAYLAVDFFFCLSGFVIAYSYDERLSKLGILNFLKLRLIRLHPLVILGSIIGLVMFMFDPFSDLYNKYENNLIEMFLGSCLMIPYPLVHERYFNLFHLNPPTWSLFWEYLANICYAIFLIKISNKILWIMTILAAAVLIYEAQRSGNLAVGWGGDNIKGGGIRVFYSFLAGILVYRMRWILSWKISFISIGALLLAVFLIPFSKEFNSLIDPFFVIVYFPILIALGAGATGRGANSWVCKFSGNISYPLYMIHYPFIWLYMSNVERFKPTLSEQTIIIVFGVVLLIVLAYAVLIWVDLPIRNRLRSGTSMSLINKVRSPAHS